MTWLDAGGVALRCEIRGSGSQRVVFIHEAGGAIESWDDVIPRVAAAWPTLRYDQRGFGHAEKACTLTLDGMVADLLALLDAVQADQPCHLVGTAIGGTIALACAAQHPHRVASVVAASPVTGPLPQSALAALAERAALVEQRGMRAVADASLLISYPPKLRLDGARFAQYRQRYLTNDPRSFAALTRSFGTIDLRSLYSRIHCPALIVGCRHDGLKPAQECADLATRLPLGRFAELDSGHFVAVQSPDLFAGLLLAFLEECRVSS